ncbi:hypothetical protein LTR17_007173 [Elasticomyces elasticus]|nr:hypothetical protein LTR17_007173 [Elasticomyces elasticus]
MATNSFTGANTGGSIQAGTFNVAGNFNYHEQADAKDIHSVCLESLYFHDKYAEDDSVKRVPGTGDWVFTHDAYLAWQREGGVLGITGRVGCGKSTLINYIIAEEQRLELERSPDGKIVICFHFHYHGGDHRQPELEVLRSLLHQLLRADEQLLTTFIESSGLVERIRTQGAPGAKWEWKKSELRDLLYKVLGMACQEGRKVLIYIDAVDESGRDVALGLLQGLQTRSDEFPGTVRVCFTSRPQPVHELERDFAIDLDQENYRDLEVYVDYQFFRKQTALTAAELAAVKAQLISRTSSAFQWLVWMCPHVVTLAEAKESLNYILPQIHGYPKELGDVYAQHLLTIAEPEVPIAFRIFEWLTFTKDPLSVNDLRHAVCLETGSQYSSIEDVKPSPHWCDNVAAFSARVSRLSSKLVRRAVVRIKTPIFSGPQYENWQIFQFDHYSVQAFMERNGLRILHERLPYIPPIVPSAETDLSLAGRCLRFLMCEEVQHFRRDRTQDVIPLGEGGSEIKGRHAEFLPEPPFAIHAAEQWPKHFRAAERASRPPNTAKFFHDLKDIDWSQVGLMLQLSATDQCTNLDEGQTLLHILSSLGFDATLASIFALSASDQDPPEVFREHCLAMLETRTFGGQTPISLAAAQGHCRLLNELIKQNAQTCSDDDKGRTPLHHAAANGREDVVERLLACSDVEVDALDTSGNTPLAHAAECEQLAAVELLLSRSKLGVHCKELASSDCTGICTALTHASSIDGSKAMLELLLTCNMIDGKLQGMSGFSLLHFLLWNYEQAQLQSSGYVLDYEKVQLLIESRKLDLDIQDDGGLSPLAMAASVGDLKFVRLLLASDRVDVQSEDKIGLTPLQHALRTDHVEIVRLLLVDSRGADSCMRPGTILLCAIRGAQFRMVQMLVKTQRAQLLVPGVFGVSPIGGAMLMYWKPGAGLFDSERDPTASFADSGRVLRYLCRHCLMTNGLL